MAGEKGSVDGGSPQLPLEVALPDHAVFESFLATGNELAIDRLMALSTGETTGSVFVFSTPGCGKTHLLQAACEATSARRGRTAFLPISSSDSSADTELGPGVLDGLDTYDLVCLDDADAIAGDADWETAVFNLFNGLAENAGRLIVSASGAPAVCGFELPDLVSRLSSGPVFRLTRLDDSARIDALQLRARKRGFELSVDTAEYLMRRLPRDTHTLFRFLDRLDKASLAEQRKLTIPFVRQLIEAEPT